MVEKLQKSIGGKMGTKENIITSRTINRTFEKSKQPKVTVDPKKLNASLEALKEHFKNNFHI